MLANLYRSSEKSICVEVLYIYVPVVCIQFTCIMQPSAITPSVFQADAHLPQSNSRTRPRLIALLIVYSKFLSWPQNISVYDPILSIPYKMLPSSASFLVWHFSIAWNHVNGGALCLIPPAVASCRTLVFGISLVVAQCLQIHKEVLDGYSDTMTPVSMWSKALHVKKKRKEATSPYIFWCY